MNCEICDKPQKENTHGKKKYCQYHNWDEQMAYLEKQKKEQNKNRVI